MAPARPRPYLLSHKWNTNGLYISTKENLYFNPSYPNTPCNSVRHFFCPPFFSFPVKGKNCSPSISIRKLGESASQEVSGNANTPLQLAGRRALKSSTEAKTFVTDSFHFLVEMSQHCEANVRTCVYIGKLRGNRASSFPPPRTETRAAVELFRGKGDGGGGVVEKMRGGVNGQLTLL